MAIKLIITTIILGVLIFIINIYKKTNIKFQFDIDKKNQASIAESEENHIQKKSEKISEKISEKLFEILSKRPSERPSEKSPERPRKEIGKNKWLYTTDNFGKMKKGRAL